MFLGHAGENPELGLGEVGPRRVVGITVYDGGNLAVGQGLFEASLKQFAPAVVYVDRALLQSEELHLVVLRGEAGVKEEDGVLPLYALSHEQEQGECALHGADSGHYAAAGDVYVEERLEKIAPGVFEWLDSGDVGIHVGHAVGQGLALGLDSGLGGWQAGVAHLEMDKLLAQRFLEVGGERHDLAYGRGGDVGYVHHVQGLPEHVG